MLWDKVGDVILQAIKDKNIQCLNLNGIDIKSMEIIDLVKENTIEETVHVIAEPNQRLVEEEDDDSFVLL